MKTVYKKAISLANKNGQNFIKEMAAYYTYIGIEEGNISNWFVLIANLKKQANIFAFLFPGMIQAARLLPSTET